MKELAYYRNSFIVMNQTSSKYNNSIGEISYVEK